ncbi:cation transporter [Marinobacter zhejiangensis]|uniref:Cation efflux family protein n=1 Tax=Marinobacter zhejiangensis TaxID=488535 RepID=A0A1I4T1E3_9GAMM|nr:cation transporter [Marinobacter zhejiangensis]SFM70562.1 Cation efflux family protein [Marinobacter zhejiangensis]
MPCQCSAPEPKVPDARFRRALWIALWVNLGMFLVEGIASFQAGSVSLMADAIDFFGDSANYVLSLSVLSMGLLWRGRAALVKGVTMLLFGLAVLARAGWNLQAGVPPEAMTMGAVGALALVANISVAMLLFAHRDGDSNMRSVWLCSRNDALSNIAVMLAAVGVFGTGSAWPDLLVAAIMGGLAVTSGLSIINHARSDISEAKANACTS